MVGTTDVLVGGGPMSGTQSPESKSHTSPSSVQTGGETSPATHSSVASMQSTPLSAQPSMPGGHALTAAQLPDTQDSAPLQNRPSSHELLSFGVFTHSSETHVSSVHGLVSSQSAAVWQGSNWQNCREACLNKAIDVEEDFNLTDILKDKEKIVAEISLTSCAFCGEKIRAGTEKLCHTCQKRQVQPMFVKA
jgi:hypothetical protein